MSTIGPRPGDIVIRESQDQFLVEHIQSNGPVAPLVVFSDAARARRTACEMARTQQRAVWQLTNGQWRQVRYLPNST